MLMGLRSHLNISTVFKEEIPHKDFGGLVITMILKNNKYNCCTM